MIKRAALVNMFSQVMRTTVEWPLPVETLADRAGTRFAAVAIAAERARQLNSGAAALVETETCDPVAVALQEPASGRLNVEASEAQPEIRDRAAV